jgi:alkylation response protein AidB-like acyl-CoA dehydrogenase
MNLDLSEDEALLRDSVERWVQQNYAFDQRQRVAALPEGFSRAHWRAFAQMGWLAMPFDESLGGLGGGALGTTIGTALLMEQLGRGLVLEPFVPAVLLFGGLLARSPAHRETWVPKVIEGQVLGTLAFAERDSRQELADVQTTLRADGNGWRLDGRKVLVAAGAAADAFVVSARSLGGRFDTAGIDCVLVPADAPGLSRTPVALMDGQRCAQLDFDGVRVEPSQLLFPLGQGHAPLAAAADDALLALGAEALGIAQMLYDTTLEYVKTRKQFGVTIGSFQALQHRLVEMFTTLEQMRSLLIRTVCAVQDGSAETRRCLHALKVMVGRAMRLIGGEAIQMHGGMGITDELVVGHGLKRLMVIDASFGNADVHRARFAALDG